MLDASAFRNPPKSFRGITLWMLNDELTVDEIGRQLDGIDAAGWGAVIGRTFNGLRTEYLSDDWMKIIREIITRADRAGLKVWLQAGYMPSGMPGLTAATAHRVLGRRPLDAPPPDDQPERIIARDATSTYFVRIMDSVLDLLNRQAVEAYLVKAYKEPWHSRFADQFGRTVEAVWVDEPHFRPPLLPWSESLPARFRDAWGYSIEEHAPSLFTETGDWQRVRHHYWRTVTAMFIESYFEPVGQWCTDHDIKFSGHLMGEDTLHNQIGFGGAMMACYEPMHLPGIDHLTMSLRWPSGKKFLLTPKQMTSAGHQLDKPEMLCEMYGVSSEAITFEDRKQIANWMAVLGVNYRCYHGSFYSLRGRRKRIYAPHLSYQQPWWTDNRPVADYFARLSFALSQGRFAADVLLIHPVESAMCFYDPNIMERPHDRSAERGPAKDLDDSLVNLCDALMSTHRGWEFGDESLMTRHARVEGRTLRVGHMTYRAVLLPDMVTLRKSTLDLLDEFARAGGIILSAGQLPTRLEGAEGGLADTLRRLVRPVKPDTASLAAALDKALPPETRIEGPGAADVWLHERTLDSGRLLYLTNTSRTNSASVAVRIRAASGALSRWSLRNGQSYPLAARRDGDCLVVTLDLAPLANHVIVLDTSAAGAAPADAASPSSRVVDEQPLEGPWTLRRHAPNCLVRDIGRIRKGNGPWSDRLPVTHLTKRLADDQYRGPVTVEHTFHVTDVPAAIQLVVEDADKFDIRVNGKSVAYAGAPYYVDRSFLPVDIASAVRPGDNTIELSINFEPVPKPRFALAGLFQKHTGMELEPVYLIGDFAVRGPISAEKGHPLCARRSPDLTLAAETPTTPANISAGDYPFYTGRASLLRTVNLKAPAAGERLGLRFDHVAAALAKVRVNGRELAPLMWAPWEVDITDAVRNGQNEIEIELIGTLRNLLGPHHRSTGEPDNTWSTAWDYTDPGANTVEHAEEAAQRWVDDYFVVNFGLIGRARITRARA